MNKAMPSRHSAAARIPLKLRFEDISFDTDLAPDGDMTRLSEVKLKYEAYAVGGTVYLDDNCADIIREELEAVKDGDELGEWDSATFFDLFDTETLVFTTADKKIFSKFDTLVFPGGERYGRDLRGKSYLCA